MYIGFVMLIWTLFIYFLIMVLYTDTKKITCLYGENSVKLRYAWFGTKSSCYNYVIFIGLGGTIFSRSYPTLVLPINHVNKVTWFLEVKFWSFIYASITTYSLEHLTWFEHGIFCVEERKLFRCWNAKKIRSTVTTNPLVNFT